MLVAKVIFLHLSVIHSVDRGGVCLSACWDTPLGADTPPQSRHNPQSRHPPRADTPPHRSRHPPGTKYTPSGTKYTPREADSSIRSTSGRYTSYWNAFLFSLPSRENRTIEFRDVNDLNRLVHEESVPRHLPRHLCMAGPSTLLYENLSTTPCEVRWLDCSTSRPKAASAVKVTHTEQNNIWDMCTVQYRGKLLLITTCGSNGVFAYNTEADKLSWRTTHSGSRRQIGADSVTTDGHSRIFVSDYINKCVRMFSLEGTHLRSLLRDRRNSELQMRWCNGISSLMVAQLRGEKYDINIVLEDTEDESSTERETRVRPRRM